MKFVGAISVIALLFLAGNRLAESMHLTDSHVPAQQTSCCTPGEPERHASGETDGDCCTQDDEHEHQCLPGCDCCCCFHITAIQYNFMTHFNTAARPVHYAAYHNGYQFDFPELLFQPPRMG